MKPDSDHSLMGSLPRFIAAATILGDVLQQSGVSDRFRASLAEHRMRQSLAPAAAAPAPPAAPVGGRGGAPPTQPADRHRPAYRSASGNVRLILGASLMVGLLVLLARDLPHRPEITT